MPGNPNTEDKTNCFQNLESSASTEVDQVVINAVQLYKKSGESKDLHNLLDLLASRPAVLKMKVPALYYIHFK